MGGPPAAGFPAREILPSWAPHEKIAGGARVLPLANRPEVWGFYARGLHVLRSPVVTGLELYGFKANIAEPPVAELYCRVTSMFLHGLLSSDN